MLALALAGLLGPAAPALRPLQLAWFDTYQARAPRVRVRAPVVIVAIDEPSLRRHGQWPWPRTVLARLIEAVAAGRPAAIGIDILMPEPDRLSPERLAALVPDLPADVAARLRGRRSNDAALARAIRGRPVVLGVAGLEREPAPAAPPLAQAPMRVFGGDPRRFLRPFAAALQTVDEIAAAAAGRGLLSVDPEAGVVRRLPLVAAVGGAVVPAFGLEMLRVAAGAPGFTVRVGAGGIERVEVGDASIPTEPDGSVWVHYAPYDPPPPRDRFVPAWEVLAGTVAPALFERMLVIVAVTAVAAADAQATPVAGQMPGAEIHAQLMEGIVDRALLSRPPGMRWAEAAVLAAGGLVLILLVPVLSARVSAAVLAALLAAAAGLGFSLFLRARVLLDVATPALGLVMLFTVMLAVTLAEANRQRRALRRQVQAQREAAARLAGELEAARRIQMGSLPSAAVALAGEERVSVYAFLEPARQVGGDLYDFFRLDADRVFFLIGDVTGKGVPGSLFMAVSKALCKSAALRRRGDVALLLQEANGEISRDNAEGLFVTAVAGILDARTGAVEYCVAGHEPPYLLGGPGTSLRRLAEGGGPPLCVVDDFAYAAGACRMREGEMLCLFTDGVTEATSAAGEFYGRARLEGVLAGLGAGATAADVGEALRRDVAGFAAGVEPADDVAILVLRWHGPRPAGEAAPLSAR